MDTPRSHELFARAQRLMPGGVNSPVSAFKSVGGEPFFVERAQGAHLIDVDGNRYIDYVGSWGPMIVGHNHPDVLEAVIQAAQRIVLRHAQPAGSEDGRNHRPAGAGLRDGPHGQLGYRSDAVGDPACAWLHRPVTHRQVRRLLPRPWRQFPGESRQRRADFRRARFPGRAKALADLTLTLPYNDFDAATQLFEASGDTIAGLIIEPVVGNANCIPPRAGFLQHLRELCDAHGVVLIFDEVMTGFRVALGGAQARFGVTPDLTTFGKVIGGGMPVGAYGGRPT